LGEFRHFWLRLLGPGPQPQEGNIYKREVFTNKKSKMTTLLPVGRKILPDF